jgi:hypothetical protein
MGANSSSASFHATVEAIDGIATQLGGVASRFAAMTPLSDTSRAQAASDSPVSAAALASFSETMTDALQATVRILHEDQSRLATIANNYRSVDEQSARSSAAVASSMGSPAAWSERRSDFTRTALEGLSGLDDVVVPAARSVTGASDRVQENLRADADRLDRNTAALGRAIGWEHPLTRASVEAGGAAAAGVLRAADSVLELGESVVRGASDLAEDLATRADRVLIRPVPRGARR